MPNNKLTLAGQDFYCTPAGKKVVDDYLRTVRKNHKKPYKTYNEDIALACRDLLLEHELGTRKVTVAIAKDVVHTLGLPAKTPKHKPFIKTPYKIALVAISVIAVSIVGYFAWGPSQTENNHPPYVYGQASYDSTSKKFMALKLCGEEVQMLMSSDGGAGKSFYELRDEGYVFAKEIPTTTDPNYNPLTSKAFCELYFEQRAQRSNHNIVVVPFVYDKIGNPVPYIHEVEDPNKAIAYNMKLGFFVR